MSNYSIRYMNPIQNPFDDNIDVEVIFDSGERFFPTFFTIANVIRLLRESAESNRVGYFWAGQMIVVKQLSVDVVASCVEDLVKTGQIRWFTAFDK